MVLHLNDKDLAATIPSGDSNVIAATVKLNKGERIYLKTRLGSLYLRGDTTTSFSGSLLKELDQYYFAKKRKIQQLICWIIQHFKNLV